MKFVVVNTILSFLAISEAANVECEFYTASFPGEGYIYTCIVQNFINIRTKEAAIIDDINPPPDEDVKSFYVNSKIIHYFPRNLDKVFPKLEKISIEYCQLKEVKKDDLKSFPNLKYIHFEGNDIDVIEEDLFVFNPKLEWVNFDQNRISRIHPNVFDHLRKLSNLGLLDNKCVDTRAEDDAVHVKSLITELKTKCVDP